MKKYDKKKKQAGFTLVEVIVVAVIVAAMAAVAVPLYLGYVESSRQNAAANAAGSLASFCGACRNSGGTVTFTPATANANGSMTCDANNSTIQVPIGITVTHAAPNNQATPPTSGVVTARHNLTSAATAANTITYNY